MKLALIVCLILTTNSDAFLKGKMGPSWGRTGLKVSPHMSYDIVHTITPIFATELTGCASVIGAGFLTAAGEENSEVVSTTGVDKPYDIYRDSLLRYAGYLNEIGEAFRPLIPSFIVGLSYIAALTYVFADGISKGIAAGKLTPSTPEPEQSFYNSNLGCTLAASADTLSFQLLASIAFPGYIINRWVTLCGYLTHEKMDFTALSDLSGGAFTPDQLADTFPTAMGLALIPIIVKPLDALTEKILDNITRPWLYRNFPPCALPFDLGLETDP